MASTEQQQQQQQLWKTNDARANKSGTRRTVYWVKRTPPRPPGERVSAGRVVGGPNYELSSTYSGAWRDNKKHGFGTQVYRNGNQYDGEWVDGRREGHGTLYVRKGGKLVKVYAGGWVRGRKGGLGVQHFSDDSRYEGEWENGQRHGTGSAWFANGDVYVGDYVEGKRSGTGTMTYANGNIYEGSWLNDMREGAGILYFAAADKVLDAEWAADIARCSVYVDASTFFGSEDAPGGPRADASGEALLARFRSGAARAKEPLPELGLADVDAVLARRVNQIQEERGAVRELALVRLTELFDADELDILHHVFRVHCDEDGAAAATDLAQLLADAGFPTPADDVAAMLVDLEIAPERVASVRLAFSDFVRAVHIARGARAAADPSVLGDDGEGGAAGEEDAASDGASDGASLADEVAEAAAPAEGANGSGA